MKSIGLILFSFAVMGVVLTQGGMNSCGTVGDQQPSKSGQCTSDTNLTAGDRCCYISASTGGVHLSACTLLPKGVNETAIEEAAKALGSDASFTCNSAYLTFSLFFAFVLALLF